MGNVTNNFSGSVPTLDTISVPTHFLQSRDLPPGAKMLYIHFLGVLQQKDGGGETLSAVARKLNMSRNTLYRHVDRLEELNLLKRRESEKGRITYEVNMTAYAG